MIAEMITRARIKHEKIVHEPELVPLSEIAIKAVSANYLMYKDKLVDLEPKYRNHNLIDNKYFKHCMECHIEPDWLLIYQYIDNELILLLVNIGSHSDLFR